MGEAWDAIAPRRRQRVPTPPTVLVSDGEEGIPDALAGPALRPQRCLVPGRRPAADFPHARRYVLGLSAEGLASLRHRLATGQPIPLSPHRRGSLWRRVRLRLTQLGRRWSAPGALTTLAACRVSALPPQRYAAAGAALSGTISSETL